LVHREIHLLDFIPEAGLLDMEQMMDNSRACGTLCTGQMRLSAATAFICRSLAEHLTTKSGGRKASFMKGGGRLGKK
jgi:hypothetical protein